MHMKKHFMIAVLGAVILSFGAAYGEMITQEYNDPSGTVIITTVDTVERWVLYEYDFTSLPYSYNQVKIGQLGFPSAAIVETWPKEPQSPWATGYVYLEVTGGGGLVETWLEVQYQSAQNPPDVNWIELHFKPGYAFAGFQGPPVEGNVQVTYREPDGGFPDGQNDNISIGAFTPKITAGCVGDTNADLDVDGLDLAIVAADFGRTGCAPATPCPGDLDGDGTVGLVDVLVFSPHYGKGDCPVL